jgi:TM2 domain-containing membrane protein YozV
VKTALDKYCFECGAIIGRDAMACPRCGAAQPLLSAREAQTPEPEPDWEPPRPPPNVRSKLAAALLAIFLGCFGVHRFYLGRPISGVVYLVFCWTLIPAVIGFVEGLWLLTISDSRFAARYP